MSFDQRIQLSIIILLTGLVVVFVMLVFLTYIIKGYSAAVRSIQSKTENDQKSNQPAAPSPAVVMPAVVPSVEAGISEETIAAISAAVYMMQGSSSGKITSIRRAAQPTRSAWGMAGLLENTRPF